MHANITVTGTTGGDGGVGRVESTGGDMTGTLTCFKLETVGAGKDIVVAGDLDMDITVADHILSDILIDGSLEGDIEVEDDDLLEGQIIINVADDSGEWNGDVIVNGTTLSTVPNYTQTSASIGGGAVGLAPFNFHATNCVPADNSTVTSVPDTVVLSHYGPVEKYGSASITELKIVRHSVTDPCALCDEDVTSDFDWTYLSNGRDIEIEGNGANEFEDGYDYHITPVITGGTILRCKDVDGGPAVQNYDYNFTVDL